MALSDTIQKLLNEQINKELYSAYLYLDMANYYEDAGLAGFANWFYIQTQEERDHAMLLRTYLLNGGAKVVLQPVLAPAGQYANLFAPLTQTLEHEQQVTASIHNLYNTATAERDLLTTQFLDWFVKEQGEEEKNAGDLIKKYELFGADAKSLYLLDQELAARVYTAPSLVL